MRTLWQDVRYGLRMLRKTPSFTAVAVLTLALGIGANTTIFSVVNAVLLRPLPYPQPQQLVQVRKKAPRPGVPVLGGGSFVGGHEFVAWRGQCRSLSHIAAFGGGNVNLTGLGQAERILCGNVTADVFPMLGVRPALGRLFYPRRSGRVDRRSQSSARACGGVASGAIRPFWAARFCWITRATRLSAYCLGIFDSPSPMKYGRPCTSTPWPRKAQLRSICSKPSQDFVPASRWPRPRRKWPRSPLAR